MSCSSTIANLLYKEAPTPWTRYSYNYTASHTSPILSFLITNGPSDIVYLDNVSVVDNSAPSIELLTNPSFENLNTSLTGWFTSCQGTCTGTPPTYGQVVTSGCEPSSGNNCYKDACQGGKDILFQSFSAMISNNYTISFWLKQIGSPNSKIWVNIT